jgi:hypothetical protein
MVIIRFVLFVAARGQAIETTRVSSRMTDSTRNTVMSLERELVLEICRLPGGSIVAQLTVHWEVHVHVVRSHRVVRHMARVAIRGDRLKVSTGMAVRAVEAGVCTG